MEFKLNSVKFDFTDEQREYLEKKFERIRYADELFTDINCTVKEDKKYIFDCTVNFRWGAVAHVSTDNYDFEAGVNKLMDMLDTKVKKEKEKIQEKNK